MSVVTNLILSFSASDKDVRVIEELKKFKYNKQDPFVIKSIDDSRLPEKWYGGSKMMEARICIGAYNHLDLKGLVTYLQSMAWEYPECVQLILKEQDDIRFKIIDIFPNNDALKFEELYRCG